MDFDDIDDIGIDLDAAFGFDGDLAEAVDLDAFELVDGPDGLEACRYSKPALRRPSLVSYEHAIDFARDLELSEGMRVFAFVSGNFVFGDMIEALVDMGKMDVRRMTVQTLSMSQDNIDSLVNVALMCPDMDRLHLVLSDYWYAHERRGLLPYLYDELDVPGMGLRVAYASIHTKITTVETVAGHRLVFHGSANMRSSRNVEQVCVECDPGLYEFCEGFADRVLDAYDVVNHGAPRPRSVRGGRLWAAVEEGVRHA